MKFWRNAKSIAFSAKKVIESNSISCFVTVVVLCLWQISALCSVESATFGGSSLSWDIVSATRCDIICKNETQLERFKCIRSCMSSWRLKLGTCPPKDATDIPNLETPCINSCRNDSECFGTLKCCPHSCGVTCQTPLKLDTIAGLPAIPTNITVDVVKMNVTTEGLPMTVRWSSQNAQNCRNVKYIVEERHHVGKHFLNERLLDWVVTKRTIRDKVVIRNLYKPGRWYQFRLTAVNEYGTRGPSAPSEPFFSFDAPKIPEAPQDLKIGAISFCKSKYNLELSWGEPHSDLPILKYKIMWSRLKNFTLVQHHHTLPSNSAYFWLRDLEPNTEYFIQVQAYTKFGGRKLAGEKASMYFRTPNHKHAAKASRSSSESWRSDVKYKRPIKGLAVDKLFWIHDQLFAHISWDPINNNVPTNYSVTWYHDGCAEEGKAYYIAKTDMTSFEVYDLQPDCKYGISVKTVWQQTLYRANRTLSTFNCTRETDLTLMDNIITECLVIEP